MHDNQRTKAGRNRDKKYAQSCTLLIKLQSRDTGDCVGKEVQPIHQARYKEFECHGIALTA
jgi:hypothetical protein